MRKAAAAVLFACFLALSLMNVAAIVPVFGATVTPVVILTMDDGYDTVYNITRAAMATYDVYATLGIITDYTTNGSDWEGCPVMTWMEVETMDADGHEIAAHGSAHRNHMANISAAELEDEINSSRVAIYENLGAYPDGFLYPHGHYNETVIDEVEKYGYEYARTTDVLSFWTDDHYFNGSNLQSGNRVYEIPAHTGTIGGKSSYTNMKGLVDEAIAANAEYCGLILHRVCPDDWNVSAPEAHGGDMNVCNFTAILDYCVNTKGLTVTSIEKALRMEFMSKMVGDYTTEIVGVVILTSVASMALGFSGRRRR